MEQQQAAQRIVAINAILMDKLEKQDRAALVAEQRDLWNSEFPGSTFEMIERTSVH